MSTRHVALRDVGGAQITVLTWAPFFLSICDTAHVETGRRQLRHAAADERRGWFWVACPFAGPLIAPTSLAGSPHPS
jgi:hypothetical protein